MASGIRWDWACLGQHGCSIKLCSWIIVQICLFIKPVILLNYHNLFTSIGISIRSPVTYTSPLRFLLMSNLVISLVYLSHLCFYSMTVIQFLILFLYTILLPPYIVSLSWVLYSNIPPNITSGFSPYRDS